MKVVVARRCGMRGAGLGNGLAPWAKGMIASQELMAHLVGPAWGLNQRRYFRNFRTSRLDFVAEELFAHLPHHHFTEEDYLRSGEIDFGFAIRRWAKDRNLGSRGSFIVVVDGLYGGYPAIWNERSMIAAKLLNSRDALEIFMR